MRRVANITLTVLLVSLASALALLGASSASAANAVGAGTAVSPGQVLPSQGLGELQPFFPSPDSTGAAQMYRADLMPVSDPTAPEILDFSCSFPPNYPDKAYVGTPLTSGERQDLTQAVSDARSAFSDGGSSKMQASLVASIADLNGQGGEHAAAAKLLDPTLSDPTALTATIPLGCGLGEFNNFPSAADNAWHISQLFSRPDLYVWGIFVGLAGDINREAFYTAEPIAFSRLFWTPHTERGDTMFNVAVDGCQAGYSNTCNAQKQTLGFNTANTKANAKTPVWIQVSIFFQWLISLTYFIIFAGAAVLYMFRGHHPQTAQSVMQLLPRLVISIFLTVFSSWIIGTMITISNLLVQVMFSDPTTMHGVRDVFLAFGTSDFGSFTGPFSQLFQVLALGVADFFFFAFYIAAMVRQLALLILIVIVPVAVAAMLFDRTRAQFSKYCTVLVTLIFTPVVLALVLKLGIAFNPAITNVAQDKVGLGNGIVGVMMLFVTFWVMLRVLKAARSIITGKQSSGLMTKLGKTTALAGKLYGTVDPVTGAAIAAAGKGLQAGGEKTDRAMGALIPGERMRALSTRRSPQGGRQKALTSSTASTRGGATGSAASRASHGTDSLGEMALRRALGAGGASASSSAKRAGVLALATGGNSSKLQTQFDRFNARSLGEQGLQELTTAEYERALRRGQSALSRARQEAHAVIADSTKQGDDEETTKAKLGRQARFVRFDEQGGGRFNEQTFRASWDDRYGKLEQRGERHYRVYNVRAGGDASAGGGSSNGTARVPAHAPATESAPAPTAKPSATVAAGGTWRPAAGGYVFDA